MQRDRIYIDPADRQIYQKIKQELYFLEDKENKDLFMFALSYGYKYGSDKSLERREGFIRTEYLNEEDWTLLRALTISKFGLEKLEDPNHVLDLAERYAHGGILLLIKHIESTPIGGFEKGFEKDIMELFI